MDQAASAANSVLFIGIGIVASVIASMCLGLALVISKSQEARAGYSFHLPECDRMGRRRRSAPAKINTSNECINYI
jgi:hypothetical protein